MCSKDVITKRNSVQSCLATTWSRVWRGTLGRGSVTSDTQRGPGDTQRLLPGQWKQRRRRKADCSLGLAQVLTRKPAHRPDDPLVLPVVGFRACRGLRSKVRKYTEKQHHHCTLEQGTSPELLRYISRCTTEMDMSVCYMPVM